MDPSPYSNLSTVSFIIIVGGLILFIFLSGLWYLVRAVIWETESESLAQRGKAIAAKVTDIRFRSLSKMGKTYGLAYFTYEYEGKVYENKQRIEELPALLLLKEKMPPRVLVLPKKPCCAKLVTPETDVLRDPTLWLNAAYGMIGVIAAILIVVMLLRVIL